LAVSLAGLFWAKFNVHNPENGAQSIIADHYTRIFFHRYQIFPETKMAHDLDSNRDRCLRFDCNFPDSEERIQ
jgi:hypothetical protein